VLEAELRILAALGSEFTVSGLVNELNRSVNYVSELIEGVESKELILTDERSWDFRPPVLNQATGVFGPLVTGLSSGSLRSSAPVTCRVLCSRTFIRQYQVRSRAGSCTVEFINCPRQES